MYYESHVTIEPVFGERLEEFKRIAGRYRFRVADLFMQKQREETPERSNKDSFCTARATNETEMRQLMDGCVNALMVAGFKVWRYKIEHVILDVKCKHVMSFPA